MSFGPSDYREGGSRGGADQFKWENVKTDTYRENYLGHSLKAPVGKWQKNKDILWYAKKSSSKSEKLKSEIEMAKERDQILLNEALGIPTSSTNYERKYEKLDNRDKKYLLERGSTQRSTSDIERVSGLGAAPVLAPLHATQKPLTLAEKYLKHQKAESVEDLNDDPIYKREKRERKAEKRERKMEKRERKEFKRKERKGDKKRKL